VPAAQPDITPAVPIFGAPEDYTDAARFPLQLWADGPAGPFLLDLTGLGEPDGGSILELAAAQRTQTRTGRPDPAAVAGAAGRLIQAMLADDDGVPSGWTPDVKRATPDGEPLSWLDTDGVEHDQFEDALPPLDRCSSRRRFLTVIYSDSHRIKLDLLTKMARWLAGQGTAPVPTNAPTRSPRGRSRSGTTSRARRA
jgi:hypothetical protein